LKRRIAGVLVHDPFDSLLGSTGAGDTEMIRPSKRGVQSLTEDDVFLHPAGMAAIWTAHQLVLKIMPAAAKSVCFG
jgi:cystathionine gamma-synthase